MEKPKMTKREKSFFIIIFAAAFVFSLLAGSFFYFHEKEKIQKSDALEANYIRMEGALFYYSLFRDLDIFGERKLLGIIPTVELGPEIEITPFEDAFNCFFNIRIFYDMSRFYGETYIFEFLAEYRKNDEGAFYVSEAEAEVTFVIDHYLHTLDNRSKQYSKEECDRGKCGDLEVKEIAEKILPRIMSICNPEESE